MNILSYLNDRKLRIIVILLTFILLEIVGLVSCKIGRNEGFNQGWDAGFIRGVENPDYVEVK